MPSDLDDVDMCEYVNEAAGGQVEDVINVLVEYIVEVALSPAMSERFVVGPVQNAGTERVVE